MPTTLYLVRHGETEYNRLRLVQGRRIDCSLNETGRMQARALAGRLRDVRFDAVYASPLRRARETAEIVVAGRPELSIRLDPDLEEMSWGIYEGEGWTPRIRELLERLTARWDQGVFDEPVEGGESILDVQIRALRAMDALLERHPGQTLLVVTHGRFLRVLIASLLETYGLQRMHDIEHANTGVNILIHETNLFRAELLNCTIHLDEVNC